MLRLLTITILNVVSICCVNWVIAQTADWAGEWITDLGIMTLQQTDDQVTGSYSGTGTISGTLSGKQLKVDYQKDNATGKAELKLSDDGLSFTGDWNSPGGSGKWRGWRSDPEAPHQMDIDFSGVWLSSAGTLQLEQDGEKVTGKYGAEGWGTINGTANGRRLEFTWKRNQWSGPAWLEITPDGKRLFGAMTGDNPGTWTGLKLEGFEYHVQPVAGSVVEGRADNGMLYYLRMPTNWKEGEKVDVVVLLHGSNWTTNGMVHVTAQNWPQIADKFAILGIQGQSWATWSDADDLRFNYTYVNWTGRSTYQGYPFTDRESPYLVMQVLDELKQCYSFQRIFVGGHSQGGYLTYVLHTHFPEKLAGTFPIAGGVIIQAEPDVFDDDGLRRDQRKTPMVIVHGKKDQVVDFSSGQYAYQRFLAHDYEKLRLLSPSQGHPYDFLPIGDAITWLDMMTTSDTDLLLKFAQEQVEKKNWRDVGAAIDRAIELDAGKAFSPIWQAYQAAAKKDRDKHLKAIQENKNGKWVDDYLAWHEQFRFAKVAEDLTDAFTDLRKQHTEDADRLLKEAREAFQSGDQTTGWAKYQELVDQYYASREYARIKSRLEQRKK